MKCIINLRGLAFFSALALLGVAQAQVAATFPNPVPKGNAPTDSTPVVAIGNVTPENPLVQDSARIAMEAKAKVGKELFLGLMPLQNGGPSCMSCHNASADDLPEGGLLAKDLTHVYARLGEVGVASILQSTPFPAMAAAYRNKPLTETEVGQLTAFFGEVEQKAAPGEPATAYNNLMIGGAAGFLIWLGMIFGIYANRKKQSVKQAIYNRQTH